MGIQMKMKSIAYRRNNRNKNITIKPWREARDSGGLQFVGTHKSRSREQADRPQFAST